MLTTQAPEIARKGPEIKETMPDQRIENARQNFRIACALRGISMSEAARRAGLSRNALAQFSRGRGVLSLENALGLADVLDVPLPLIYRQDGITEGNIRLYRALERMPTHELGHALEAIKKASSGDH
ncbi:helix-turn-helix domain-containing protein [Mameliella alba]|uniref:helix-turn-helix domain-containing protein n=1 Tax=Mameliella alba TaxID=561184 RepID=UPI001C97B8CE|nr:helix-turn-helix transcriptional regulator [Mameliella alba]MBY6121834.1 helix-turn-helix domain-containing protein [Mameliella alba]